VVGEDCQLSRRCLTRCFAVLVERRVVNEGDFRITSTQVTAATLCPIRSPPSFRPSRPTGYPTLVAYNAQLLPSLSTANPNPLSLSTPDQSCKPTAAHSHSPMVCTMWLLSQLSPHVLHNLTLLKDSASLKQGPAPDTDSSHSLS